jgi:hypothetical protein
MLRFTLFHAENQQDDEIEEFMLTELDQDIVDGVRIQVEHSSLFDHELPRITVVLPTLSTQRLLLRHFLPEEVLENVDCFCFLGSLEGVHDEVLVVRVAAA